VAHEPGRSNLLAFICRSQEVFLMPQQRNILTGGLSLTLRNWPAFVWTYVSNLVLAWLFTLPLQKQLNAMTAHSLASARLTGAFDLSTMGEVFLKLSKGPGPATMSGYFTTPFYLAFYFFIVPGTLFCYQTGEPARLFTLLRAGIDHFWRFVRITLVTLVVFAVVLGGLDALQNVWATHVDNIMVGRKAFLLEESGMVVVGLVAALLRVYFDLVQVYTVSLGQMTFPEEDGTKRPERQIRRTFKPAWRTYSGNFFRVYLTFVFLTLLGLAAVVFAARTAMHSLAQPRVWPMFLLAQLGLFLMLLTRFWQRGAETILALDNPIPAAVVAVRELVVIEPIAVEVVPEELVPGERDEEASSADESNFSI
jgi:hypothetical protein